MWNQAFVGDFPQNLRVEDVRTKLSCETSLKKWKWKMWKRSFQFNSIELNWIEFYSIQFNTIQLNSIQFMQFNSVQFNSSQLNSFNFIQVSSFQFNSIQFIQFNSIHSIQFNQFNSIQFNSIRFNSFNSIQVHSSQFIPSFLAIINIRNTEVLSNFLWGTQLLNKKHTKKNEQGSPWVTQVLSNGIVWMVLYCAKALLILLVVLNISKRFILQLL
jgi:hypothetical protein